MLHAYDDGKAHLLLHYGGCVGCGTMIYMESEKKGAACPACKPHPHAPRRLLVSVAAIAAVTAAVAAIVLWEDRECDADRQGCAVHESSEQLRGDAAHFGDAAKRF